MACPTSAPTAPTTPTTGSTAEGAEAGMGRAEMVAAFRKITAGTVDEQCAHFLREFVADFAGCFEEVLELAEEFKRYSAGVFGELEEDAMHRFLEKRGETLTVVELREKLRRIDLDANGKTAFVEYAMCKYDKTLPELFAEKPESNAALLKQLEAAIEAFQAVLAKRAAAEARIAELTTLAGSGAGVKAMRARAELEQMRVRSQTGQNMAEVRASFKQKRAKKALDAADPVADELARVEAEKRRKATEAAEAKAAGQRRLKERAAFLGCSAAPPAPPAARPRTQVAAV